METRWGKALKGLRAATWSTLIALWALTMSTTMLIQYSDRARAFTGRLSIEAGYLPHAIITVDAIFYTTGALLILTALAASRVVVNAQKTINQEQIGWIILATATIGHGWMLILTAQRLMPTLGWLVIVLIGAVLRFFDLKQIEARARKVQQIKRAIKSNQDNLAALEPPTGTGGGARCAS